MNNLGIKAIQKQPVLGDPDQPQPNPVPGLLKKKPAFKTAPKVPSVPSNLFSRLTK